MQSEPARPDSGSILARTNPFGFAPPFIFRLSTQEPARLDLGSTFTAKNPVGFAPPPTFVVPYWESPRPDAGFATPRVNEYVAAVAFAKPSPPAIVQAESPRPDPGWTYDTVNPLGSATQFARAGIPGRFAGRTSSARYRVDLRRGQHLACAVGLPVVCVGAVPRGGEARSGFGDCDCQPVRCVCRLRSAEPSRHRPGRVPQARSGLDLRCREPDALRRPVCPAEPAIHRPGRAASARSGAIPHGNRRHLGCGHRLPADLLARDRGRAGEARAGFGPDLESAAVDGSQTAESVSRLGPGRRAAALPRLPVVRLSAKSLDRADVRGDAEFLRPGDRIRDTEDRPGSFQVYTLRTTSTSVPFRPIVAYLENQQPDPGLAISFDTSVSFEVPYSRHISQYQDGWTPEPGSTLVSTIYLVPLSPFAWQRPITAVAEERRPDPGTVFYADYSPFSGTPIPSWIATTEQASRLWENSPSLTPRTTWPEAEPWFPPILAQSEVPASIAPPGSSLVAFGGVDSAAKHHLHPPSVVASAEPQPTYQGTIAYATGPVFYIPAAYDGTSVLAAAPKLGGPGQARLTKLWYKTAPENANVFPYVTYFLVSEPNEIPTTGFDFYRSTVQFNFHASLAGRGEGNGRGVPQGDTQCPADHQWIARVARADRLQRAGRGRGTWAGRPGLLDSDGNPRHTLDGINVY